jgi:AcrR family transcriptional regulator
VTTLAEEKQRATVNHILAAARQVLVDRGPDATMDDIATAAGMSRRTLFRYFPSRDSVLASALKSGMRRYGERLPLYDGGGDWTGWLADVCRVVHEKNASYGLGYFELIARRDLTGELAEVEARRKQGLRISMSRLADALWSAAGGAGSTPPAVQAAVAVNLSAHFTAAVIDAGHDGPMAAELAATAIASVVRASLQP